MIDLKDTVKKLNQMTEEELDCESKRIEAEYSVLQIYKNERRLWLKRMRNKKIRVSAIPKDELEKMIDADFKIKAIKSLIQ